MSWQEKFLEYFGSGYFFGITLGDWLAVLKENRYAVAPSCLIRAAAITLGSVPNTVIRQLELQRFRKQWEQVEVLPPLFVLGHWRTGTTHLQNLLCVDDRFAYLNALEASYPDTFLLTERFNARLVQIFSPKKRPFDNVRLGFDVPSEDDVALACATRVTPYLSIVFPLRRVFYDRFLTFQAATTDEVARWRDGLNTLLKKLTLKYNKPLILKSPPHTCRIRLLLAMFPQAKFVHIHRDPYAVIQSMLHTLNVVLEWTRLQNTSCIDWTERALCQWREMFDAYFAERSLIPAGNLHEVAFTDLEQDPIGELRRLYEALALPDFSGVEPKLTNYVASIAGYKKNLFSELPAELRRQIGENCRRGFEEWGYER